MSEILAQGPGLSAYLTLAAVLFCIGLYGVLTRKNIIAVLISVELMANAVNINLIAFARFSEDLLGQAVALFFFPLNDAYDFTLNKVVFDSGAKQCIPIIFID